MFFPNCARNYAVACTNFDIDCRAICCCNEFGYDYSRLWAVISLLLDTVFNVLLDWTSLFVF